MSKRVGVIVHLLCIVLAIAGCTALVPAFDCTQISPAPLTKYLGRSLPPLAALRTEIEANNSSGDFEFVAPPDVSDSGEWPAQAAIRWRVGTRYYTIDADDNINTSSTLLYGRGRAPLLREAVACLGAPREYWAWYGETNVGSGWSTLVMLLYPDQGVVLYGIDLGRRPLSEDGTLRDPAALASVPLSNVVYLLPTSSDTLVARMWQFDEFEYPPALRRWYVDNIKPWPGDWDRIEVLRERKPW